MQNLNLNNFPTDFIFILKRQLKKSPIETEIFLNEFPHMAKIHIELRIFLTQPSYQTYECFLDKHHGQINPSSSVLSVTLIFVHKTSQISTAANLGAWSKGKDRTVENTVYPMKENSINLINHIQFNTLFFPVFLNKKPLKL